MSHSVADEVVDQVDAHWHGRLRPRLEGLTDDEYLWEPVAGCWTLRPRTDPAASEYGRGEWRWDYAPTPSDAEPVTTIAWRLAHLIVTLAETTAVRLGGPPVDAATFAYAGTAEEAMRQLDEAYAAYVDGIGRLGDDGLAAPQGASAPPAFADKPVARVLLYTHVEVFHHGAEVCLLRDLYRRR